MTIIKEAKALVDDGVQFPTQLLDDLASDKILYDMPKNVNREAEIKRLDSGSFLNITLAAPNKIGKHTYFMGVMLQRDNKNQKLQIHDVILKQEASVFLQDYLSTKGAGKKNKNLSISNILVKALYVNPKYMEAVRSGDMQTAQKLVNALAQIISLQ